jgi:hypothetical protein
MKRFLLMVPIAASFAFAATGAKANEPDPTDDGNIIVECIGVGDPTLHGMSDRSATHAAFSPRHPLGPMTCGPKEQGRLF